MEFLPGNHSLEQTISVTNLTWLTPHGDSSSLPEVTSRVVCTWPAGFTFTNVTELYISALGFLSCGHNDSAAVSVISVQQTDISNCIFQNSTSGALYVDASNLTIMNNVFRNNSASCGGALGAWKNSMIIAGNTFYDNSAIIGNVHCRTEGFCNL